MALPMLVGGGAECGPSNPLQGLSKRFDHDRGLQQDQFGAGRAESSRETFRTQQSTPRGADQEAAFFFNNASAHPQLSPPNVFDMSAMQRSLTPAPMPVLMQQPNQIQQTNASASWASDFMVQQPMKAAAPQISHAAPELSMQQQSMQTPQTQANIQWNPMMATGYRQIPMTSFVPTMSVQIQKPVIQHDQNFWEKEFLTQETSLKAATTVAPLQPLQEIHQNQQIRDQTPQEQDELARTAGLLVESVSGELNPKFQNSQFMGLMRQLRDRKVVVEGNEMVEKEFATTSDVRMDVKGKGKALDPPMLNANLSNPLGASSIYPQGFVSTGPQISSIPRDDARMQVEDPNDEYFRQENEDYTRYWDQRAESSATGMATAPVESWDELQRQWENFEATATGIKPVVNYQFQTNNPYMLEDSSTRHHMTHTNQQPSSFESVLELEAAVQRDPMNAGAWYELGVKQQENEREQKALQALQRAIELDPTHLPTWLALAISHTNDGNRLETYDSIKRWVDLNEKYQPAVQQFFATSPLGPEASVGERYNHLVKCLIAMARSDMSGDVDADIQIALAVILNTNEEYDKAQDCFRTALAVRPDDSLLYNRVGATMANSGQAEEALEYYYQALALNPGYIRARYNLGISCINLRRYEEAAQHIIHALCLQDHDGVQDMSGLNDKRGVTSDALWDTLKTTCMHMQKLDLATLCDRRDLEGVRDTFQV